MIKKSFSKLGKGSEKLSENLQSFLVSENEENESLSESSIISIDHKVGKEKLESQPDLNTDKEQTTQKKEKKDKRKTGEERSIVKSDPPVRSQEKPLSSPKELPDDFRSHSVLVSKKQLSQLQEKVLLHKVRVNRKYSMKQAFFEALKLWLSKKEIISEELPDDYVTYSALFSESQFNDFQDKLLLHKARVDRSYSIKKSLYEAINLYLRE